MCKPKKDNSAQEAREREEQRQARIRDGAARIGAVFGQFNDDFFGQRRQAYLDFAMPQLDDQYADARRNLTFALSRGGNLNSTVAGERSARLRSDYDRAVLEMQGRGQDYATQARQAVEENRAALMSSLNATGDADAAANGAAARAVLLSAQPSFGSIGPYFQNVGTALQSVDQATGGEGILGRLWQDRRSRSGSGRIVQS